MNRTLLFTTLLLVTITACSTSDCKGSYFEYKTGECCLDTNHNTICDSDEEQQLQEIADQQAQLEATRTLQEKLANESSDASIYAAVQQSFPNNCYVYTQNGTWNERTGEYESSWQNFMNAKCATIQDCVDLYKNIGATDAEIQTYFHENRLVCAEAAPQ